MLSNKCAEGREINFYFKLSLYRLSEKRTETLLFRQRMHQSQAVGDYELELSTEPWNARPTAYLGIYFPIIPPAIE